LNGLMMAITIFIWFPILVVRGHAASPDRSPNTRWFTRLSQGQSNAVPVSEKPDNPLKI
jgi:hypothetical protein